MLAHHGIAAERGAGGRRLAPHGPVSSALRAGTHAVFERAADLELITPLTDAGITHAVASPVHWHGRHFGGLFLADRGGTRFDADQVAFAEALARRSPARSTPPTCGAPSARKARLRPPSPASARS